jgi:hypothetical protein
MSSDNVMSRSIATCRDTGIVSIDLVAPVTITGIMDAVIEASHCTTQIVGCIKGSTSVSFIVTPACCMTKDGCLKAASASLACSVRERLNHVSSDSSKSIWGA